MEEELYEAACRFYGADKAEQVVTERFHLFDEVRSCREIFGALQSCMDAGWERYFEAACEYHSAHGDLNVPRKFKTEDGLALGDWITTQRRVRAGKVEGRLTREQIEKLDGLGMTWGSLQELAWERFYEAARIYQETYGNLLVPKGYETADGLKLGAWIMNQRQSYANFGISKRMTPERIEKLNDIGMVWSTVSYQWEENYAQAAKYYAEHGNLEVPAAYETADGFRLGAWLQQQRATRRGRRQGKTLSREQVARLDAIGMRWGRQHDGTWMIQYENARQYAEAYGHLQIPVAYQAPDGSALGKWLARQRTARRMGELSRERIRLLDEIGMAWGEDPWQYRYELAWNYKKLHGTTQIPAQYKTPDGIWLGKWMYLQKKAMKEPMGLTNEQRNKLQQLLA